MSREFIVTISAAYGFLRKAEDEAEAERGAKIELSKKYPNVPLESLSSDLFHWEVYPANEKH